MHSAAPCVVEVVVRAHAQRGKPAMSLFSRLFRRPGPEHQGRLCDWMQQSLSRGIAGDQVAEHVKRCPICSSTIKREPVGTVSPDITDIAKKHFPKMGPTTAPSTLDMAQVIKDAKTQDADILIIARGSSAFDNPERLITAVAEIARDPSLKLVFDVRAGKAKGPAVEPMIIVRRDFFLTVCDGIDARNVGQLGVLLVRKAIEENVRFLCI